MRTAAASDMLEQFGETATTFENSSDLSPTPLR